MIMNSTHAHTCKKIYLCPSTPKGSCQWEGDAADILEHFQDSHKDLLMDSNTIKADVTQDSEQNRLIASEKGLFLVQTKVCVERAKLLIRLRFLPSTERASKMSFSIEVSAGKFAFINEPSSGEYNPVYNVESGIEVDIQAVKLIQNLRKLEEVTIQVNMNEEAVEEELGVDEPDKERHQIEVDKFELKDIEESCEEFEEAFSNAMINCTTCHYNMIPPIYMCPDGHSVCYSCRNHACSVCGQKITELRNIDLEEHSKTLDYPCRYGAQGCVEKYKYSEIRRHEIHCEYCTYKCELCPYEGRCPDVRTHFRIAHPSTKIFERMSGIHFPRGSNFVIMNSNGVFYCTSCATETQIEWKVAFCGPKERTFSCEVQITGKKLSNPVKHYFLKRNGSVFKLTVNFDELKSANVKEKNSYLCISCY